MTPDLSYHWEEGREQQCEETKWDEEKITLSKQRSDKNRR